MSKRRTDKGEVNKYFSIPSGLCLTALQPLHIQANDNGKSLSSASSSQPRLMYFETISAAFRYSLVYLVPCYIFS